MYTYDERLRAVELCIKLGKHIRATINQLSGYTTKNSLKQWHQDFLVRRNLRAAYSRSTQEYSIAQKNVAIEHYMNHGQRLSKTTKTLGYPARAMLTEWVRERYPDTRRTIIGRHGRLTSTLDSSQN